MKLKNKINRDLVFFTLDQIFNSNLLYCSIYKSWSKEVSIFLYGSVNGINFFKFSYTLFLLRKSIFFLKSIYQKGGSVLIINDDYINRKIFHKSFEKIPYIFYINNKWVGGTLTNFKKIFNHLLFMMFYCKYYKLNLKQLDPLLDYFKNYFIGISKMRKLPSCLFLLSSDDNFQNYPVIESRSLELPVLGSFNSDINYYIDYGIPMNSSNSSSLEFISFLLRNVYLVSLLDKKKLFINSIKLNDFSFKGYRSYKLLKKCLYQNLFFLTKKLLNIKKNNDENRYIVYQNSYERFDYKKKKKDKKFLEFLKSKFLLKSSLFIKNRFLNRNFSFLLKEKIPVKNCSIHYYLNLFEHVSLSIIKDSVIRRKNSKGFVKSKFIIPTIDGRTFLKKFNSNLKGSNYYKKYLFGLFRFSYQNYIRFFDEDHCFSCLKVRFKAKKWLKKKFIFKYKMYNKEETLPFMFTKLEVKNQKKDLRYRIFFDFFNNQGSKIKKVYFYKNLKKIKN